MLSFSDFIHLSSQEDATFGNHRGALDSVAGREPIDDDNWLRDFPPDVSLLPGSLIEVVPWWSIYASAIRPLYLKPVIPLHQRLVFFHDRKASFEYPLPTL